MKSFMHDTSAFDDEKVYELYLEYDYKGIGIFYVILEKLAHQEKPIKEKILKKQLNLTKREDCIIDFMVDIDLLQRENEEISNENLMNYIDSYVTNRKNASERMRKHRDNQQVSENVTRNKQRSYTPNTNTNTNTNTKEKKQDRFSEFWELYGKKVGKPKALAEWKKLKDTDIEAILKATPNYTKTREPQFRKDPERFLKHRVWEDEVVFESTEVIKPSQIRQSHPRSNEIIVPEDF